ncbi:TPA: hypothetical protein ACPOKR_001783, partial [Haemophilus influenzae]
MLILIIEDELSKLDEIRNHILNKYAEYHPKIDTAGNLCDAKRKILSNNYDVVIFDIFLPFNDSSKEPTDISDEILSDFNYSANYKSESIAITKLNI